VGLDWAPNPAQRVWMERACRAAQYPIVLRPATLGKRTGYARRELLRYTRNGVRDASALLVAGRVVLVFPEGYPNVDPAFAQKTDDEAFLPFARGYERIVASAERASGVRVPIVPVGFHYTRGRRWSIVARFGRPVYDIRPDELQSVVRELSTAPDRGK
jgi:hypothetical protein